MFLIQYVSYVRKISRHFQDMSNFYWLSCSFLKFKYDLIGTELYSTTYLMLLNSEYILKFLDNRTNFGHSVWKTKWGHFPSGPAYEERYQKYCLRSINFSLTWFFRVKLYSPSQQCMSLPVVKALYYLVICTNKQEITD